MEAVADTLVPDGVDLEQALARTTHLGIGAHPDDLEIIAIPGILTCLEDSRQWFTGVVVCDGAGSPRSGAYKNYSDRQMVELRRQEQREAAQLGRYAAQLQLGYTSDAVRNGDSALVEQLSDILTRSAPKVVYLHNLADSHATHRAVSRASLAALRALPSEQQPEAVFAVEVWGSLDWLPPQYRRALPIDDPENLQGQLLRCHNSQVSGGKRYDEAIRARQRANATMTDSHATDRADACVLAMDLRPLLQDPELSPDSFLERCIADFAASISA